MSRPGGRRSPRSFDEIMLAAQQGDGDAFATLFDLLNRRVHAFAAVRGSADPESLVNEVFIAVFGAMGSFRGNEAQFKGWVFRIARNKLIDEHRRSARLPQTVELAEELTDRLTAQVDVESQVLRRLDAASLRPLLAQLTDEQRDVLLLRTVADLSIEHVAELLGKKPAAIKALQRRALRAITRALSNDPVSSRAISTL